jgi:hypothetical protein
MWQHVLAVAMIAQRIKTMEEPEQPRVDCAVLDFIKGNVFDAADFMIRTDGVCWLNPRVARMVVARVSA